MELVLTFIVGENSNETYEAGSVQGWSVFASKIAANLKIWHLSDFSGDFKMNLVFFPASN